MTVSNTNIVEKWDEIEQYLNDKTHDTYNEFLPEDFTDPEMADMYEPFIKDVNRQLAKVKDATPQKKSLKHKFTKGKSGKRKVAQKEEKPKRKVKSSSGKSSSGKSSKTSTKEKKPSKPKVGEEAQWQNALRTFARMCGKDKTVNSVRKFVLQIQSNFAKKLGKKTPNIELIREIQTKLLPYANKIDQNRVQLPEWADFKAKCQAAAKEWTVSKTVKKPDMSEKSLSGLKKKTSPRKVKKAR